MLTMTKAQQNNGRRFDLAVLVQTNMLHSESGVDEP